MLNNYLDLFVLPTGENFEYFGRLKRIESNLKSLVKFGDKC